MGISKTNVKYISLEGGGGAGNAYVGALKALYDLNILQYDSDFKQSNIKGFSGASAGAITSVLLGCGYTPGELGVIMNMVNFEDFFDLGDIGEVPSSGGFVKKNLAQVNEPELLKVIRIVIQNGLGIALIPAMLSNPRMIFDLIKEVKKPEVLITVFNLLIGLATKVEDLPKNVKKILAANKDELTLSVYNDWGMFVGKKLRIFITTLINYAKCRTQILRLKQSISNQIFYFVDKYGISVDEAREELIKIDCLSLFSDLADKTLVNDEKMRKQLTSERIPADAKGTTFSDFKKLFGCDLVIMGTNLETNKSHAFSAATTPEFYVEDAVRLSMSLPLIFKPFIHKDTTATKKNFLDGVWIDGGYLNNSPINIFNSNETIGIRLEQGGEHRNEINEFTKFLAAYPLGTGLMGTGEAHISETMAKIKEYNTIVLDTKLKDGRQIGLFDFKPEKTLFDEVNKNAYQVIKAYFK